MYYVLCIPIHTAGVILCIVGNGQRCFSRHIQVGPRFVCCMFPIITAGVILCIVGGGKRFSFSLTTFRSLYYKASTTYPGYLSRFLASMSLTLGILHNLYQEAGYQLAPLSLGFPST